MFFICIIQLHSYNDTSFYFPNNYLKNYDLFLHKYLSSNQHFYT